MTDNKNVDNMTKNNMDIKGHIDELKLMGLVALSGSDFEKFKEKFANLRPVEKIAYKNYMDKIQDHLADDAILKDNLYQWLLNNHETAFSHHFKSEQLANYFNISIEEAEESLRKADYQKTEWRPTVSQFEDNPAFPVELWKHNSFDRQNWHSPSIWSIYKSHCPLRKEPTKEEELEIMDALDIHHQPYRLPNGKIAGFENESIPKRN